MLVFIFFKYRFNIEKKYRKGFYVCNENRIIDYERIVKFCQKQKKNRIDDMKRSLCLSKKLPYTYSQWKKNCVYNPLKNKQHFVKLIENVFIQLSNNGHSVIYQSIHQYWTYVHIIYPALWSLSFCLDIDRTIELSYFISEDVLLANFDIWTTLV